MNIKHGGKRAGAGRPLKHDKKILIALRLSPEIVDWLRSQDKPQAYIVENALNRLRLEIEQHECPFCGVVGEGCDCAPF